VHVEIPREVVDAEIERHARGFSRTARIPGFRPGKAPTRVVKQRFKERILHEVAHDLIPQALDQALRERGVEAVETPDVRDVTVEEGQPLTFTASFETVPPFEAGDYTALSLSRPSVRVEDEVVSQALEALRGRAARYDPVEDRGIEMGDTVTVDLVRRWVSAPDERPDSAMPETHTDVTVELGAKTNPPGFDEQLIGLAAGATKTFLIHYPGDYAITELAGRDVSFAVTVKSIRRCRLPELDDEFAKDLGTFETLDALRAQVRTDLEHEARQAANRQIRAQLMTQVARWIPFDVPRPLVERDLDRRVEALARRLIDERVDPREADIDWAAFRESQRAAAREAVAATLALEAVARREQLEVSDEDVEREVLRYAERTGRTPAAARAALEKEGSLAMIRAGLRREKTIDFLLARARISGES
jgi:trigger factor